MQTYRSVSGSSAEDLFIELFSDTFGAEKAGYLYSQYPFSDIYQNSRFADFLIENGGRKVAIEIDDEASHNPKLVSRNKFYDDLLKQNSMICLGWDVYRWAVRQIQQLGRGMRLAPGKESLMVFDFVDNASQYNMPYSMHRLFRLKEYKPGALVLGTKKQKTAEQGLYDRGERPEALIDWPVDALDYELVDIFNWQEEAADMISQMEFVRRVDVQTETIERYVREGLLVPDLVVPMSEHRTFKYFKEETLQKYAQQYGWTLIDDANRKDLFLDMVRQMDMSYSYKPVLLKAVLLFADDKGRVKLSDIVTCFREFYEARRAAGLVVEKANSIYAKGGYTDTQAQRNILSNPFKRFEDMQMLHHTKTLGVIQVDESVWKKLTREEKQEMERICDEKLERYFQRLNK